jgi:predicted dinucleotide-binding enzyme
VVKSLNTMNCNVVDPEARADGRLCERNDTEAKAVVISILRDWFGWKSVIDLGDIRTSRGVEMFVVLWQSLRNWTSSHRFNIRVVT